MLLFKKIRYKNFLSTGNAWNEYTLDAASNTLIIGNNGAGKCFCINTLITVRNRKTGEERTMTVGEFYAQTKQTNIRQD